MILSGDAGGTKTELALFKEDNSKLEKVISQRFLNKDFQGLEDIIKIFLKDKDHKINSACIGIAGTVIEGIGKSTNLPWVLDENVLSEKLNIKNFKLANDLEIIARAVPVLDSNDLITIYNGDNVKKDGNKAVIAPGTGLGQAALICSDGKYNVVATEGGHTDFAASTELEFELFKYSQKKYGHVSYERIASGLGIVNIFNFLKDMKYSETGDELLERLRNEDEAEVISNEALNKRSKICEKTLDVFASVLGAQTGNMVLNYKATGGVYLGGNIPLMNIHKLTDGTFINSYLNKGRLSYLTQMTPVYVIKDKSIGLSGAALIAANPKG
ncbi:MAG: glucokinase [Ignavibacteria bacterium]|nr:glucokinase [Ignavibacteria bacterium]